MIDYNGFSFAAPPRTGSTWFVNACYCIGLGEKSRANSHVPPPKDWKGYTVSLVRHPASWLVSYFSVLEGGKIQVDCVDALAHCYVRDDMMASLKKFLRLPKNTLTKMFDEYQANTVIRLEDFPWGPLEFFQSLGYEDKSDSVKKLRALNIGYGIGYELSARLRKRIIDHEPDMCERYEYFY